MPDAILFTADGKILFDADGKIVFGDAESCCYYQLFDCPAPGSAVDKWVSAADWSPGDFIEVSGEFYHIPSDAASSLCPGTIVTGIAATEEDCDGEGDCTDCEGCPTTITITATGGTGDCSVMNGVHTLDYQGGCEWVDVTTEWRILSDKLFVHFTFIPECDQTVEVDIGCEDGCPKLGNYVVPFPGTPGCGCDGQTLSITIS